MSDFPLLQRSTMHAIAPWLEHTRLDGGVALIDKEEGWTSFDCVAVLRNRTRIRRVGHAGTLDPLATGLLVVCFGKATKSVEHYQAAEKEYVTTVKLGASTATDDRGAAEEHVVDVLDISSEQIAEAIQRFVGTIEQVPPAFSAIRHEGKRQYDMARRGETFEQRMRTVTVHGIDILDVSLPYITLRISCSKGTYIRSIARDLGSVLGVGGYAYSLRRTRIGTMHVDDAVTVGAVRDALAVGVAS